MNLFSNSKHKGSDLLTRNDNNQIFDLVGRNCKILSTTVIELHRSPDATGEGDWTKEEIGVLCLVQISNRESHFFRMFCLFRKRLVWEYEIRKEMQYSTPKPFLHCFQAKNCMYAFYFVSEQEAGYFANYMRDISLDLLENEHRSENSKLHEINPVVEPPSDVNSRSKFNSKTTITGPGRLSTTGRLFSKCLGKTDGMKKKNFTGDDIATPGRFKHVSHICEFKQVWCQIQGGNCNEDDNLIPMQNLSALSESILPVVKETPIQSNSSDTSVPPLPSKKSHSRNHFSTFIHPGEEIMQPNVANLPPPLPEKKSPRMAHRQSIAPSSNLNESHYDAIGSSVSLFSGKRVFVSDLGPSNPKITGDDRIPKYFDSTSGPLLPEKKSPQLNQRQFTPNPQNHLLNAALFDSKSASLDDRWSNLNPFRNSTPFSSNERAYNSLSNSRCRLDSHSEDTNSSESDSLSNYPKPPPLIVGEKRKTKVEVDHKNDDQDPSECHYDTVPCRPRPVHSSRSNSVPHSEQKMCSSRNLNERELSLFPNSSTDFMMQTNPDEKKMYEVAPVTTKHPFLLPPSSISCSTTSLKPACTPALANDPFRNALNAAIKKGVELKRTDGARRKSFSREKDG